MIIYKVVERLRLLGFKDLFYCIAYVVAKRRRGILLTMDRTFKYFLSAIGEDEQGSKIIASLNN